MNMQGKKGGKADRSNFGLSVFRLAMNIAVTAVIFYT